MATTPYPLPRQTRATDILVGNGTAGPYGPTPFKVFDIADVVVFLRPDANSQFVEIDDATAVKTSGQPYDTVSVTFAAPVTSAMGYVIASRRLHERLIAVTKGGAIASGELEKELSKQGTILQELKRDYEQTVKVPLGRPPQLLPPWNPGKAIAWHSTREELINAPVSPGDIIDAIEQTEALRAQTEVLRDQTGVLRDETAGLKDEAAIARDASQAAQLAAQDARDDAQQAAIDASAAANLAGYYDTKIEADAAIGDYSEGQSVEIGDDGVNNGIWQKVGGVWVQRTTWRLADLKITLDELKTVGQVIGRPIGAPMVGANEMADRIFVAADAVTTRRPLLGVPVRVLTAGTAVIYRYVEDGTTKRQVGPDYPVTVTGTGNKLLTPKDYGPIVYEAGEHFAFRQGTARFAFVTATADGAGWYNSPDNANKREWIDGDGPNLDLRLDISAIFADGDVADNSRVQHDFQSRMRETFTIGRPKGCLVATGGAPMLDRTYTLLGASTRPRFIKAFGAEILTAGTAWVKRSLPYRNNRYAQVGDRVPVTFGATGVQRVELARRFLLRPGEILSLWPGTAQIAFTVEASDQDGFVSSPLAGDQWNFFQPIVTTAARLQLCVEGEYGELADIIADTDRSAAALFPHADIQVIGRAAGTLVEPTAGGTSNTSASLFYYEKAAERDSKVGRLRVSMKTAGDFKLSIARHEDNTFTRVGAYVIPLGVGVHDLGPEDFGHHVIVPAGHKYGFYGAGVAYVVGTGDSGGYYSINSDLDVFIDAEVTTGFLLMTGIDLDPLDTFTASGDTVRLGRRGDNLALPTATTAVGDATFYNNRPSPIDGVIPSFPVTMKTAGVVHLKVGNRNGSTITEEASYPIAVPAGRWPAWPTGRHIPIRAGQHWGHYSAGAVGYTVEAADDGGFFDAPGNAPVVIDATPFTGVRPHIGVNIEPSILWSHEQRLKDIEAGNSGGDEDQLPALPLYDGIAKGEFSSSGLNASVTADFSRNGIVQPLGANLAFSAVTGTNVRYDRVFVDTGAVPPSLVKVQGTERVLHGTVGTFGGTDASYFRPEPAVRQLPLFTVRVAAGQLSKLDDWKLFNGEPREIAAFNEEQRRQARSRLAPAIAGLHAGQSFRYLVHGNSIYALASALPPTNMVNGALRDRADALISAGATYQYLFDGYQADVIADLNNRYGEQVLGLTAAQLARTNDVSDVNPVHTKIGEGWNFMRAIEGRRLHQLGTNLWYDNNSIPTYSASECVVGTGPGDWVASEWLETTLAWIDDEGVDLCELSLPMNDWNKTLTLERYIFIIEKLKETGVSILVKDSQMRRGGNFEQWRSVNRAVREAADYCDVAWFSYEQIDDPLFQEVSGETASDDCKANNLNHPGVSHYDASARLKVKIFYW